MHFNRNRPVIWLVCAIVGGSLSACVTGTSVLIDRCAASDEGIPTQEEIDACATLETNPRLRPQTIVATRLRQAMAYYELGEYEKSDALYSEIIEGLGTPALAWYGHAQTQLALGNPLTARREAERGMDNDGRIIELLKDLHRRGELDALLAEDPFYQENYDPSKPWVEDFAVSFFMMAYEEDVPLDIRIKLRQRALSFTGHYDGPVDGTGGDATDAAVDACIVDACWERFGTTM